jgi:uncharacterized phage protein gp47/JayE
MPWTTPTLRQVRTMTRDYVLSQLGAKALIPNSSLRILSDSQSGLTYLTLLYLDWLSKQLLPDTAEQEWLDRHGQIWLVNADGSKGRKAATYAAGTVQFSGTVGLTVLAGTQLAGSNGVFYLTTTLAEIGSDGLGQASVVAQTAGSTGNLPDGTALSVTATNLGIATTTCLGDITGGVDTETDDELRERVLFRIQNPPMGGDAADYVAWATAVPGVTRAWAAPEIGPGTITIRFLMDDLYPDNYGLPQASDIITVSDYINSKRPVTVADCFVMAPILQFYSITISNLSVDNDQTRASIEASITAMEKARSKPGQTMYRSWVDEAISQALGEQSHELTFTTLEMPGAAYMPICDTILYE